jgi:hypothetical protein
MNECTYEIKDKILPLTGRPVDTEFWSLLNWVPTLTLSRFAELPEGLFPTFISLERSSTQIRTSVTDVRFGLEEEEEEDWVQDRFETF